MTSIHIYKKAFLLPLLLLSGLSAWAQSDTAVKHIPITYVYYLKTAEEKNLAYAAEKFNLTIAKAEAIAARVFPDPELSFGIADQGQRRMKMGYAYNAGLSYTLELGGKRQARIAVSNRQVELAELLLADYFRNLRAETTTAFISVLKQRELLKAKVKSYGMMNRLSIADAVRFKSGAIAKIDAQQSELEAASQLNEVFQQEADWKAALIGLNLLAGTKRAELFEPIGNLQKFDRNFDLQYLLRQAKATRSDLLVAFKNKQISADMLKLSKSARVIDLGLSVSVAANSVVANAVAPTPSTSVISIGLSMPLKFSNNNHGAIASARYSLQQSELLYQQTALQIETEVTQAYYNYLASQKQVMQFTTGMLDNAEKILEGKLYSYKRGENSLLEVLNAQRTFNEVQQNYLETLTARAMALLDLEKASGVWDLDF